MVTLGLGGSCWVLRKCFLWITQEQVVHGGYGISIFGRFHVWLDQATSHPVLAIALLQADVWSILLWFYVDISTCAALPLLELVGMIGECKTFEVHTCFHNLVFIVRFSHPKISNFNSQIYFLPTFLFYFVLNSMQNKRCFWKADTECNQYPLVNVHPLVLEETLEYQISASASCVNACVLVPLFFPSSNLAFKVPLL